MITSVQVDYEIEYYDDEENNKNGSKKIKKR